MHPYTPNHKRAPLAYPISAVAVALLGLTCAPLASAQYTITTSVSDLAPTENIALSNTATPGGVDQDATYAWKGKSPTDYRDVTQTFTVGADGFYLDAFAIKIGNVYSSSDAGFTMTLSSYDSATEEPLGEVVWTNSGVLPTAMATDQYLTFDLDETFLDANTTYGIAISYSDYTPYRQVGFYITYGSSLDGGALWGSDNSHDNWAITNNDLTQFYLLAAVPEPSTWALIFASGAFAVALGVRRFRRN